MNKLTLTRKDNFQILNFYPCLLMILWNFRHWLCPCIFLFRPYLCHKYLIFLEVATEFLASKMLVIVLHK